jgi:hypothetical protein
MPFDGPLPQDLDQGLAYSLYRGRHYLASIGWCQGCYRHGMARCAVGALGILNSRVEDGTTLQKQARSILDIIARRRGFATIVDLNDDPASTLDFVLSVYDEALAEVRSSVAVG